MIRVLLTKSFIDSHDRAIGTIAKALRDSAIEVILIDYELPYEVCTTAIDEDVDLIGMSFMSGGQVEVTQRVLTDLNSAGMEIPLVVGGAIRPFDVPELERAGVKAIFRGGEKLETIVRTMRELALDYQRAGT